MLTLNFLYLSKNSPCQQEHRVLRIHWTLNVDSFVLAAFEHNYYWTNSVYSDVTLWPAEMVHL